MEVVYFLVQNTLPVAIPLLLAALGGMFAERSGVINLALEGIMLFGAFFGCLVTYYLDPTGMNAQLILLIALAAAAIAGAIYSLALAFAAINMKADQTIVGTAMNMLVPALVLLISKMFFMSDGITTTTNFYIKSIPLLGQIPVVGDLFFKQTYLTVYIGVLVLIAAHILLYRTRFGLRLRACGEHPQAADSVGINVYRMRYAGVMISGMLGGLGGFAYAVGVMNGNCNGHTGVAGFGFLALAVKIYGQWKPVRKFLAALFFAFLRQVANSVMLIPFLNDLNIPKVFYNILPYIATMVVLAFTSSKSKAPKAEGIPYDKGSR